MIKAYTGKTGSGKTYLMVKEAYKQYKQGRNIYSNTVLMFPKKKRSGKIKYFETINEVIDIKDGLVLFDEAQVLFNARNWESLPDEFQYKLQQHRKHQIDLICTTQNMGTVDIAYRRLVHEWIHCKNYLQIGGSPRILIGIFKMEYKDIDHLYNQVDDLVVPTIKGRPFIIWILSRRLYDTMYDIGFRKFKILWLTKYDLNLLAKRSYLIIPKKMELYKAVAEIERLKKITKIEIS